MTAAGVLDAKDVFLKLLREFDEQKRRVSSNSRSGNYAPREFERLLREQRSGFRRRDFETAMNALFSEKRIEKLRYGRPGDERFMIAISEPARDAS